MSLLSNFTPPLPSSLLGPYHLLHHVLYPIRYPQINFAQTLHCPPSEVTENLPETNFAVALKNPIKHNNSDYSQGSWPENRHVRNVLPITQSQYPYHQWQTLGVGSKILL